MGQVLGCDPGRSAASPQVEVHLLSNGFTRWRIAGPVRFVLGGFWANHVLFADIHPRHTVPNVIVAAVVVWLLWFGYPGGVGAPI